MSKLNLKTLKKGDHIRISHNGKVVEEDFVVGGYAGFGALAGAFYWVLDYGSGDLGRIIGARVDEETGAWYEDRGWELEKI